MKHIKKFNESNILSKEYINLYKSEISKKIDYILDAFVDLSDKELISSVLLFNVKGKYQKTYRGDLRNIQDIVCVYDNYEEVVNYILNNWITSVILYNRFCLSIDISYESFPIEGASYIKSTDDLENIIVSKKRLEDSDYEVLLDFNSNHHQFKPIKIHVYFDIKNDFPFHFL